MKSSALVTGAGKRIGQAIALNLAAQGFSIVLHYHQSNKEAKITAATIRKYGVHCEIFPCDLSNENTTRKLIGAITTTKNLPPLRLLVNCASIFEKSQLRTSNIGIFSRHLSVNFTAPLILSRGFVRICNEGQIINILDTHVVDNKTAYSDYLLSKKLLTEFTRLAAVEFAPHIRVNAIAPGLILPPKGEKDSYLKRLAQSIPLKRKGNPRHIAHAVRFLVENDYITGQTIFVDGGENLI